MSSSNKNLSFKLFRALGKHLYFATSYLIQGIKQGLGCDHLKKYLRLVHKHVSQLTDSLGNDYETLGNLDGIPKQKLRSITSGLHSLLPKSPLYSYSILIPITNPVKKQHVIRAFKAALDQTAPSMEVLIGVYESQFAEISALLEEFKEKYSNKFSLINLGKAPPNEHLLSHAANFLGNLAKGNYLFLLDPSDWIRPDLLFRYEQTLRLLAKPEQIVLYCNEYQINDAEFPIPNSQLIKPERIVFPYVFSDQIKNGMLIPTALWKSIGGLRSVCYPAETFDLALRLDIAEASFHNVPFLLYAQRKRELPAFDDAGLIALNDYVKNKKLNWKIQKGYLPATYRGMPEISKSPRIHVIIPFKNQRDLTLNAVKSVMRQEGVAVAITAVDNGSDDKTISETLQEMGCEVLFINEPFNYSRLNNLAVARSRIGKECSSILFLNNDVDLDKGALFEMSRWCGQPHIGMVGCRLNYPNGLLQHGGVELHEYSPIWRMTWEHIERLLPFEELQKAKEIHISKAVTAACALVKKSLFLEVGGFDEIWYPIAYSDTNLAIKFSLKGLSCIYTPYAWGIHHESVSRKYHNIEDYENSVWLHKHVLKNFARRLSVPKSTPIK